MPSNFRSTFAIVALAAASACVFAYVAAAAAEQSPSIQQVEEARRCASKTKTAGQAFAEVRDSVRAGGTTQTESLLDEADVALKQARAACAADQYVSAQLGLLADEAAALRRSLR